MIATIDQFLRDPGAGDPQAILSFVRESPAVLVIFHQGLVAHDPRLPDGTDALLVAGFAAGNARSQLVSGVKRDSPVDGVRGMLAVYAFLKSKNAAVSSAHLDELAARAAEGTLEATVAERLGN